MRRKKGASARDGAPWNETGDEVSRCNEGVTREALTDETVDGDEEEAEIVVLVARELCVLEDDRSVEKVDDVLCGGFERSASPERQLE